MSTNTKLAEPVNASAVLRNVLNTLKRENDKPDGSISDTIWYSAYETLLDYVESSLEALAAHDAEQALPLKDRPDFIAGYYAGLKDGRACERRDAAEQAAQAVPAGFKWVPVEPTEDMLTAAGREDDKAFVDGMPHGATAADVWAAMLSASPKPEAVAGWRDIETAPKETEVLIGRWIDGKFKWGSSELFYEQANEFEGETFSGWVWSIDYCDDSVAEAPTHWIPLPAAPPEPTHD